MSIEERAVLPAGENLRFSMRPDVAAASATLHEAVVEYSSAPGGPSVVEIPLRDDYTDTYLEVRSARADRVVTEIEVLSPVNKRAGGPMPLGNPGGNGPTVSSRGTDAKFPPWYSRRNELESGETPAAYCILVSRSETRPQAEPYTFNVRAPIPTIPIPLLPEDEEPRRELFYPTRMVNT